MLLSANYTYKIIANDNCMQLKKWTWLYHRKRIVIKGKNSGF